MAAKFAHMKYTNKAPYQAPGTGDLELMLERGILTTSIGGVSLGISPISAGDDLDDASGSWVVDW